MKIKLFYFLLIIGCLAKTFGASVTVSHIKIYPGQTILYKIMGQGTHFTDASTKFNYSTTELQVNNYTVVSDIMITMTLTCIANNLVFPIGGSGIQTYCNISGIDGLLDLGLKIGDPSKRIILAEPYLLKREQTTDLYFYCEYTHFASVPENRIQVDNYNRDISPVRINLITPINDTCIKVNITIKPNIDPGLKTFWIMNAVDGTVGKTVKILALDFGRIAGVSPATVQQSANTSFAILASNADFTTGTNTIHFKRNGIIDSNISVTGINVLTSTTLNIAAFVGVSTPPGLYDVQIQNSVLGNLGWNKCFLVNSPAFNGVISNMSKTSFTQKDTNTPISISGNGLQYPAGSSIVFYDHNGDIAAIEARNPILQGSYSLSCNIAVSNSVKSGKYNMVIHTQTGKYIYQNISVNNSFTNGSILAVVPSNIRYDQPKTLKIVGKGIQFDSTKSNIWIQYYSFNQSIPEFAEKITLTDLRVYNRDTLGITIYPRKAGSSLDQQSLAITYYDDSSGIIYAVSTIWANPVLTLLSPNAAAQNSRIKLSINCDRAGFDNNSTILFYKDQMLSNHFITENYKTTGIDNLVVDVTLSNNADTGLYTIRCMKVFGDYIDLPDVFRVSGKKVGLKELQQEPGLKVYPNPAKDLCYVSLANMQNKSFSVELWSLDGKQVYNKSFQEHDNNLIELQVSSLEKGIYIIRLVADDSVLLSKILIE